MAPYPTLTLPHPAPGPTQPRPNTAGKCEHMLSIHNCFLAACIIQYSHSDFVFVICGWLFVFVGSVRLMRGRD